MEKAKRSKGSELVLGYLENISSKVFSDYPKEITTLVASQHGVYALYKKTHLYYVGLATNLKNRVKHHLQDKHEGKWDKFSLYLVRKTDHIKELESLLLRIADPKGNAVKGRLPHAENLSMQLRKKMQKAHDEKLAEILGFKKKQPKPKRKPQPPAHGGPTLAPYVEKRFPIRVDYKGTTYKAIVRANGTIKLNGRIYNSPSLAGKAVIGRTCNGWSFWRYKQNNEWVRLSELREQKKYKELSN